MKLILSNNQTERFVSFYAGLQKQTSEPFDYVGYESLLFVFDVSAAQPITVHAMSTGRQLTDYDGVYINGYLAAYESAAAVAICCDALNVPFVNKEMRNAPSLSKLTAYAKLAAAGVSIPKTLAGTKAALLQAAGDYPNDIFPAILKRADADRGVDNFKLETASEVAELLADYDDHSIWLLQVYIENEGFYLTSYYDQKPAFCIYRTLERRPDGDVHKAHMYKPVGGANASLIELGDEPKQVVSVSQKAITALDRQIGSVDCLLDRRTQQAYVLEVNYNPQLVTIETLKDVRVGAFLENLTKDW